jgi:hypothetical protein
LFGYEIRQYRRHHRVPVADFEDTAETALRG